MGPAVQIYIHTSHSFSNYLNRNKGHLIRQNHKLIKQWIKMVMFRGFNKTKGDTLNANTRVETLIVATIYLQLIQNRYMFRSFTVLQCSHQHCVQPVASDVEVVGYL